MWSLNNTLLNNQQITEKSKREIKIYLEMNENENTTTQNPVGHYKSSAKRKVHSNQAYLKKQVKSQINNLLYT